MYQKSFKVNLDNMAQRRQSTTGQNDGQWSVQKKTLLFTLITKKTEEAKLKLH